MSTETWAGYPPEVNAGRWEMGTGPETWVAASTAWTAYGEIVQGVMAALMGEIAQMTGVTLTGAASVAMMTSSVPFFGWLAAMEGMALIHATATGTVAAAWGTNTAGIIPEPVVNQNRISEATAEATNFFGQNTPLIGELNREYAQFWTQNGVSMTNYDDAVTLATAPKMAPPPPPLSSVGQAAALAGEQMGKAAAGSAQQASSLAQSSEGLGQAMEQGGSQGMGEMSSMMQMPMQAAQSLGQAANPSSLMQPAQSLMQPLQSMMGQFMNGPQMGGGLGDSAFAAPAALSSTGGVPMGGGGMGGGGMGGGMGGGGGGMMGGLNGSSQSIKATSNLSGVPGPQLGSGQKLGATQGGMGGGGMGGAGRGGGGSESSRKSENIVAAEVTYAPTKAESERERALFS